MYSGTPISTPPRITACAYVERATRLWDEMAKSTDELRGVLVDQSFDLIVGRERLSVLTAAAANAERVMEDTAHRLSMGMQHGTAMELLEAAKQLKTARGAV
mgnify:CR=1 FL=1